MKFYTTNNTYGCIIDGAEEVCPGSVNTASVPEIEGAAYNWEITNGTYISDFHGPILTWKAGYRGTVRLKAIITVDSSSTNCSKEVNIIENIIPTVANLSLIMEVLKRPCQVIFIEERANIQNIMNALEQLQRKGQARDKVFYLNGGEYKGCIDIHAKNLSIKSEFGADAEITSVDSDLFNILINNTSNVSIEGVTLKNGQFGICVHSSDNCKIYNNSINDFSNGGLLLVNSADGEIQNNILNSTRVDTNGVQLDSSENFFMSNNSICVNNFEYYVDNQSTHRGYNTNKINVIKAKDINCIDIFDNQMEYYCNDSMICLKNETNKCIFPPLITNYNEWRLV